MPDKVTIKLRKSISFDEMLALVNRVIAEEEEAQSATFQQDDDNPAFTVVVTPY